MKDGIGEGFTREDHPDLSNQLFALYAKVQRIRGLAQIVGEADLSDMDRAHMDFGRRFEKELLGQDPDEARDMEETLEIGWRLVEEMPPASLDRLSDDRLKERGITP
jgi:V/A-type H+-transporting ATPase subunit B